MIAMDVLAEIVISVASQAPIIAFVVYFSERDRRDFKERIDEKNELITKYRERDWQRADRLENSNRTN